jgi:ATP-dependent protease ClpP protease subunit
MAANRLDKNKLNRFWNFTNSTTDTDTTELVLYSEIAEQDYYSWWRDESTAVTPKTFRDELNAVATNNICVRINSNGGSVFAASAIATMLRDKRSAGKTVNCKVDGICASAAVLVALACGHISIAESAYMMVHDPMSELWGMYNASEMREMADVLDTIKAGIVAAYVTRTGLTDKECEKMMSKSTWMTGKEAVEKGFADEIMFEGDDGVVENHIRNAFVNTTSRDNLPNALKEVLENKNQRGEKNQVEIKNISDLRGAFPELMNAAEQEIRKSVVDTVTTEATAAERERIKAIDALAGRIDASVLNEAKYGEKPMTADEVIVNAFKAGKMIESGYMNAAQADAAASNGVKNTNEDNRTEAEKQAEADKNGLIEACKNYRK